MITRARSALTGLAALTLLVLLVAAPVAQGHFPGHPVHASSSQSRESA